MADVASTALLRLELHDWWHCSAGAAVRAGLNATTVRKDGLPLVPGRTVKGLLREALFQAEIFASGVPEGATAWLCGETPTPARDVDALREARFSSSQAALVVDDATLPAAWLAWAAGATGRKMLDDLGTVLHATRIDGEGQVVENTLRSIEVMPPMTLHAPLTLMPQDHDVPSWAAAGGWKAEVSKALPLLRGVGSRRNRGLGRVTASLVDAEDAA